MTARTPFNPRRALAEWGGCWMARQLRDVYGLHGIALGRREMYRLLRFRGVRAVDAWRWAGAA